VPDSTPLYRAAVGGDAAAVRALLAAGADPDEESFGPSDGTPLCGAACWGYEDAVRALLEGGADPNRAEADGFLPLQWAALGPHHGTAAALLEAGADPNPPCAPLVIAADRGAIGLVQLLLAHGADPALRDESGRTAVEAAEAKAGVDIEGALVAALHGDGPVEVRREPRPGGSELIEVSAPHASGRHYASSEDGHAQIAALLRGAV
jgi:ankyrin repeat protein